MDKLTPKQLQAAKDLVTRYNNITIKEINNITYGNITARRLTGFGNIDTCTLCIAATEIQFLSIDDYCKGCIHQISFVKSCKCYNKPRSRAEITYKAIEQAKTPEQLIKAFKARAKYIQHLINMYNKHFNQ